MIYFNEWQITACLTSQKALTDLFGELPNASINKLETHYVQKVQHSTKW